MGGQRGEQGRPQFAPPTVSQSRATSFNTLRLHDIETNQNHPRTIQVTDVKWVTGDGRGVGRARGSLKVHHCSSASGEASWGERDSPLGCLLHSRLQGLQTSPVWRWTPNWLMGLFFSSGWGCQCRGTQSRTGKYIQGNAIHRAGGENRGSLIPSCFISKVKSSKANWYAEPSRVCSYLWGCDHSVEPCKLESIWEAKMQKMFGNAENVFGFFCCFFCLLPLRRSPTAALRTGCLQMLM